MSELLGAGAYCLLAERSLETVGMSDANSSRVGLGLLTPKEAAVVWLAASGSSNAEIAGRLVVNVKTVEYHLTHIYAKFGVTSRRELAIRFRGGDGRDPGRGCPEWSKNDSEASRLSSADW